jgi:hypothetical protein
MMADNLKTSEAIRKIYDEMWAEILKSQAQRFQIMMETSSTRLEHRPLTHTTRLSWPLLSMRPAKNRRFPIAIQKISAVPRMIVEKEGGKVGRK